MFYILHQSFLKLYVYVYVLQLLMLWFRISSFLFFCFQEMSGYVRICDFRFRVHIAYSNNHNNCLFLKTKPQNRVIQKSLWLRLKNH